MRFPFFLLVDIPKCSYSVSPDSTRRACFSDWIFRLYIFEVVQSLHCSWHGVAHCKLSDTHPNLVTLKMRFGPYLVRQWSMSSLHRPPASCPCRRARSAEFWAVL